MDRIYLPQWATLHEACEYLSAVTKEPWPLARLLDSWVKPFVWLEYSAEAPQELFQGRSEGLMLQIVFANDHGRMAFTREGLLTLSRLPDGRFFKVEPGIAFSIDDLRYARAAIEMLAARRPVEHPVDAEGVTWQELAGLFDFWTEDRWKDVTSKAPDWIADARVGPVRHRVAARWSIKVVAEALLGYRLKYLTSDDERKRILAQQVPPRAKLETIIGQPLGFE